MSNILYPIFRRRPVNVRELSPRNGITWEWLREHGFRIETPVICEPCMKIVCDPREDTWLELSPCAARVQTLDEWHCWFRNDLAGRRARFIHLRTLRTIEDVQRLYLAIAGKWLEREMIMDDERRKKFQAARAEARREGDTHWNAHAAFHQDWIMRKT